VLLDREAERQEVIAFLDAVAEGPARIVVDGPPGSGRSALWRHAGGEARSRSYRVLASQPTEAERDLPFVVLTDLLEPVLEQILPALTDPERGALAVVMLLAEAGDRPPDLRAVSMAVLHGLRVLARSVPLVVAVDDEEWVDRSSRRVLAYVSRRLVEERIGVLTVVRAGGPDLLDPGRPGHGLLRRVSLGPLTPEATAELLHREVDPRLPAPVIRELHEIAGGNPLFALEIARAVAAGGTSGRAGAPLAVPQTLRELLRDRLASLSPSAREIVTLVGVMSRPAPSEVCAAAQDPELADVALGQALQSGVVESAGGRLRLSNPVLGSILYEDLAPEARRDVHARVARVAIDPEERVRHAALAVDRPDPTVAGELDRAADRAFRRGAPDAAARLEELALERTPTEDAAGRRERAIRAGEWDFVAGEPARTDLLFRAALDASPTGPQRADALRRLGWLAYHQGAPKEASELFARALEEAGEDDALRAVVQRDLAFAGLRYGDLEAAARHARAALDLAERLGDDEGLAEALTAVSLSEAVLGRAIRADVLQRAVDLEEWAAARRISPRPSRTPGLLLTWTEDLEAGRARLEALLERTLDRGDQSSLPIVLHHLADLELRAGNWARSQEHALRGYEAAVATGQRPVESLLLYSRAAVAAHRGEVDAARALAVEGATLADGIDATIARLLNRSVLGFLALSLGNPAEAHHELGPLVEQITAMRLAEPTVISMIPDEIAALAALGALDAAEALIVELERRGRSVRREWAAAVTSRARGVLASVRGDSVGAVVFVERALTHHRKLAEPFELARTLLSLGAVQRRARQKATARESLQRAMDLFTELDARLWVDQTRSQLDRSGFRPAGPFDLTETEEQIAELVARGMTNMEAGKALFVTDRTIEANLSKIYRKLGVRSRTELAVAWGERQLSALASRTDG
jgi:DNA-binding CsgD family transcriptional regulator